MNFQELIFSKGDGKSCPTKKAVKEKKQYKYKNMMTPYDKLKSLPNAGQHLKDGITFIVVKNSRPIFRIVPASATAVKSNSGVFENNYKMNQI